MATSSMDWFLNFVGKFSDSIAATPWYFQMPVWALLAIIVYVLISMIRAD